VGQHLRDKEVAGTRPAIVVDASVLVKWFVEEEFSQEALRLRAAHLSLETRIVVPSLARYEVLNALKYSARLGTEDLVRASKDLEAAELIEISPDGEVWEKMLRIAAEHGLTVYDSAYLALGFAKKLEVYTADEKMLETSGALDYVRHLRTVR